MIDIFRYRKNETPETNYLRWLCDDVGLNYDSYRDVASTMLYFEFNDEVDNDINRTWDAIANREDFEHEYDVELDLHDEDHCGILEMMVVLARRAADIMYESEDEDQTPYYFWLMFTNLGLDEFDTYRYDHQKVAQILRIFNNREYDEHGNGGLFHVKSPLDKIQEVEIWTQMNWYLTQKWFEKQ